MNGGRGGVCVLPTTLFTPCYTSFYAIKNPASFDTVDSLDSIITWHLLRAFIYERAKEWISESLTLDTISYEGTQLENNAFELGSVPLGNVTGLQLHLSKPSKSRETKE
jgi:hypothetical protein